MTALISYRHTVTIVTGHGEPGTAGRLYPAVIDGAIVAAWPRRRSSVAVSCR